jgi:hypothetical protein
MMCTTPLLATMSAEVTMAFSTGDKLTRLGQCQGVTVQCLDVCLFLTSFAMAAAGTTW